MTEIISIICTIKNKKFSLDRSVFCSTSFVIIDTNEILDERKQDLLPAPAIIAFNPRNNPIIPRLEIIFSVAVLNVSALEQFTCAHDDEFTLAKAWT